MLRAYDFNLAFDDKFDRQHFMKSHVFAEMLKEWPPGFREKMESRIKDAF